MLFSSTCTALLKTLFYCIFKKSVQLRPIRSELLPSFLCLERWWMAGNTRHSRNSFVNAAEWIALNTRCFLMYSHKKQTIKYETVKVFKLLLKNIGYFEQYRKEAVNIQWGQKYGVISHRKHKQLLIRTQLTAGFTCVYFVVHEWYTSSYATASVSGHHTL